MTSDRSIVEREMDRLELAPFTLEGFHRRRERRDRDRRIRAGITALLVVGLGAVAFIRALPSEIAPAEEHTVPPAEAEINALVESFLGARISGEGAEGYLRVGFGDAPETLQPLDPGSVPLLYATSDGAPYERSAFTVVRGSATPPCATEFRVRLVAEDGTVVEQDLTLECDVRGGLGLGYRELSTTEEGRSVAERRGILQGGEVTAGIVSPWDHSWAGWEQSPTLETFRLGGNSEESLAFVADARTVRSGCGKGPVPTSAVSLAWSIASDPDLRTTEPTAVRIAGSDALQLDVLDATAGNLCDEVGIPEVIAGGTATGLDEGQRMRLYLIDYPDEAYFSTLAVAIVAPEPRFEAVLEAAAPIVGSLEFNVR